MTLTVIIPCYNERRTIRTIVERVQAAVSPDSDIIIVDDASTDGTGAAADTLINPQIKVVHHSTNRGKGAAIDTGLQHAKGDMILIQDADLEYDPKDYYRLLEPLITGQADVVFGSRFLTGQAHRVVYFWHMLANRCLTLLSNVFTNINLTDMETGYKVFRRDVVKNIRIEEERFGCEPEITAKLAQRGARFYEVGVSYHGRTYEEGKKIGFRDALRAFYVILKYNLFKREKRVRGTAPVADNPIVIPTAESISVVSP